MLGRNSSLALFALACVCPCACAAQAQQAPASPYAISTGESSISSPGNSETITGKPIRPGAFPAAQYCAGCHKQAYTEWRHALHSNSFREPFYRHSVNILRRTKGMKFTRHCDSCHNPIGVLSGALASKHTNIDETFDEDGVTCMTCHSIVRLQPTRGNGSYVMGIPSVMVDANGKRIPGEVPYSEIMAHPKRHAHAVMHTFLHSPKFCAACHKANLPYTLNHYKFIPAFDVYDEWQQSKFSHQSPLNFYSGPRFTCQNCHMMREMAEPGEDGAKHDTFASHRWLAGNTGVPFYYGYKTQLKKTIAFLRSGMFLHVDLFGLEPQNGCAIEPLGSKPFTLAPNQTVQVWVVIQNKNIGHSLIPEVRDLYQTWVEFEVKDADGKAIYHSGFLNPDGTVDARAHTYTNSPVDSKGEFVDDHEVWTIHSVAYDNTIQSGRSDLVRYEFHIPARAKSPLTITARVNYRHYRQSYINHVLGPKHPAYPIVVLASQTRTIHIGRNAAQPPDPNDPKWMRWNNIGIAYLYQLQYADALNAFEHVVKLRPKYADGYINVALTYLKWERYSMARPDLEKALALKPGDARALYYRALLERREGHDAAEFADLQQVIARYPDSRDARRELGIYYYQLHQYTDARKQFELLQAIDPDSLAAHYNLSVVDRRLGMKKQAAMQAALFATKQVDPQAPSYALDYLRLHPELSIESVPWHLHKEMGGIDNR